MPKGKVSLNYLYNVAYQILLIITPLITAPYLARNFGADSLGVYNYTYSIVYWFILFGMFGINLYGNRQIAKVSDDREKRSKTFWEIFTLQLFNIIISVIVFYLIFCFVDTKYHNIFMLQGLMVIAALFDISWFYNGIENFKKITIRNFIAKLLNVLLIFLIIKNPSQIIEYVCISIALTFFSNIVMWIGIRKYIDFIRVKISDAYKHFKGTAILFLPQVSTVFYTTFTQTLIGFLYDGISDVTFYAQAYNFISMCLAIITALGTVMLPRIVNSKAHDGEKKVTELTNKTFKLALLLSLPLAFGLAAVSLFFIPWFLTESFITVAYLLIIMSVIIIFIALTNVMGTQYLLSLDRDKEYTISVIIGSVVNVIMNLLLIPKYGAIGAAISTVITELIVFISQFIMVRKTFDFTDVINKVFKYFFAALTMGICIYFIGYFMGPSLSTNILQFVVGVFIYLIILLITKDDMLIFILKKVKDLLHIRSRK